MNFYKLSDITIAAELGQRFRSLRLQKNRTQAELAEAAAVSLDTIKALEKGRAKLATVIAVLRELDALDQLDGLVPKLPVSPLQLAKRRGRPRQRAAGSRGKDKPAGDPEW